MRKYQPYHSLVVWRVAHEFVLESYKCTEKFPRQEIFGLVSQFRRAVVSIVTNLVEGHGRRGKKECLFFTSISVGSLRECNYLIELSSDLKFLTPEETEKLQDLSARTGYLLNQYIEGVKKREDKNNDQNHTKSAPSAP